MTTQLEQIVYPSTPFPLAESLILLGRRGSESHGLRLPDKTVNDRDLMGIVVPPKPYYLGLKQWEGAEGITGEWDVVLFEVRKFIRLLMKQNPNVLELLWVEEDDVLHRSVEGTVLIGNRDLFRHEGYARNTFAGYAHGQLQKMTAFDAPTMAYIDDLERRLKDGGVDPQHVIAEPPIEVPVDLEIVADTYRAMRKKYRAAYMGAKRWESVREFKYDVKNAGHLVRLLHTGVEYLTQGKVNVRRTWDREMLLEIKRGEWELERIKEHAELWFSKLESAKSVLPVGIDEHQVEQLVLYIIESRLELGHVMGS